MIAPELKQLADAIGLERDDKFALRIRFGITCIERVEHHLTDPRIVALLGIGKAYTRGECQRNALDAAAAEAAERARSHAGSGSIDGSGSAAVSTSHGLAAALRGDALQAAGYAAYAAVYAYSGSAVLDVTAYAGEHRWQSATLRRLLDETD